ncbi:hypothetical protein P7C70_g9507, partial [Phenoliferia sp. Uapishka_3]
MPAAKKTTAKKTFCRQGKCVGLQPHRTHDKKALPAGVLPLGMHLRGQLVQFTHYSHADPRPRRESNSPSVASRHPSVDSFERLPTPQ